MPEQTRPAIQSRPPVKQELESLTIEVTTACDLRCTNCFALAALPQKSAMPFAQALLAAHDGYAAGFRTLHLTGGEPTIWKPFFELIEAALTLGYERIFFNTHGGFLDDAFCRRLAAYGGRVQLSVSLNGPEKIHDAVRGEGTYRKALAGLRTALDHELHTLVFTVIGRELLPDLPGFARSLYTKFPDIAGLALIPLHRVTDDYYDVREELLRPEDFGALVSMVATLTLIGYRIRIQNQALANAVAAAQGLEFFPTGPHMARYGRLTVLRDGRITVAHSSRIALNQSQPDQPDQLAPGSIQDIVRHPDYAISDDATECIGCDYEKLCADSGNPAPPTVALDDQTELYCRRALRAALAVRSERSAPEEYMQL